VFRGAKHCYLNARQDDEAWRLHGHPARRTEEGGGLSPPSPCWLRRCMEVLSLMNGDFILRMGGSIRTLVSIFQKEENSDLQPLADACLGDCCSLMRAQLISQKEQRLCCETKEKSILTRQVKQIYNKKSVT